MKKGNNSDIYIVVALTLLAVAFISIKPLDETPIRAVLGLALTLFLPGYALVSALFPGKKHLGALERIALAFGLSIAVTPLMGLALNYTPFGIEKNAILFTVSAFTILFAAIAWVRRIYLEEEAFGVVIDFKLPRSENKLDSALTALLIIAIIASFAVLIYVIVTPKQGEKFTEFFILGPGGKAENYPTRLVVGDNGTVIVGVVNHEYAPVTYELRAVLAGFNLTSEGIRLGDNQTYMENYTFSPVQNGTQELEFLLYKEGITQPYRTLHLWVTADKRG